MLISEISRALTKQTSASDVARFFAERLMSDPALLRAELYGDGPLTRKRFCELLGIGDSTLTGWLQTERIPQSAAVAYVLFLLSMRLLEEVEDIKADREQPRVVELQDGYAVVKFVSGDDGEQIGRTAASGIGDLSSARQIAFAQSKDFTRLLGRQMELVDDLINTTVEAGNDAPYRMAALGKERSALDRLQLLISNANGQESPKKNRSKSTAGSVRGAS